MIFIPPKFNRRLVPWLGMAQWFVNHPDDFNGHKTNIGRSNLEALCAFLRLQHFQLRTQKFFLPFFKFSWNFFLAHVLHWWESGLKWMWGERRERLDWGRRKILRIGAITVTRLWAHVLSLSLLLLAHSRRRKNFRSSFFSRRNGRVVYSSLSIVQLNAWEKLNKHLPLFFHRAYSIWFLKPDFVQHNSQCVAHL